MHVSYYLSNLQTCQCKEPKFSYEPHGNGDVRVIENTKLRELVPKGQSTGNQIGSTRKLQKQCVLNPLISMQNIAPRENKYLSEWKDHLKELVGERISNLKGHLKSPKCEVLDQPDVEDTLHTLCTNYVLVPVDKAAKKYDSCM